MGRTNFRPALQLHSLPICITHYLAPTKNTSSTGEPFLVQQVLKKTARDLFATAEMPELLLRKQPFSWLQKDDYLDFQLYREKYHSGRREAIFCMLSPAKGPKGTARQWSKTTAAPLRARDSSSGTHGYFT